MAGGRWWRALGVGALLSVIPAGGGAQEGILGDLGGLRDRLADSGLTFEWVYTGELIGSSADDDRGGSAFLGNLDLTFALDAEEAMGWGGAELFLYFLGNHGDSPSEFVGDLQVVSNIDAYNTFKLYEAWVEQQLFSERMSLKAGLIDLNSEFDVIEAAGIFHNSSFGIGPDYSQSGKNGPSIFPTTSAGVRVNGWITPSLYARTIILDGVSGDPDDPEGTQVNFDEGDGLLVGAEVGWTREASDAQSYRKFAVGGWGYTEGTEQNAAGTSIDPVENSGWYVLGEQSVHQEEDPAQGLVVFARYGSAHSRINPVSEYFGAGATYTGLFPGRDDDLVGLAFAHAIGSEVFRDGLRSADISPASAETAIEFTYVAAVTPWLVLRPDLQYVVNPGLDADADSPLLAGLRVELVF